MKNNIIAVANWKGGCGKTLVSALLCHYLRLKEIPVMAIDADIQQSLFRQRMFELQGSPDVVVPWELQYLDTSDVDDVREQMKVLKDTPSCVVVDCPGNITDPGMVPVYEAADIIVVPFTYDFVNVDATFRFAQTVRKVSKARFIFVPNRINLNEEKGEDLEEERLQAIKLLKVFGWVTPRIKQGKSARKYRTITGLTYFQRKLVEHSFDDIVERLKK